MNETRRAVLDALAEGPVSGPAMAERLDVSRAAVWKHVEALRSAGFVIENRDGGYALTAVPEFGSAAIECGLEAPYRLEYHDAIPSTNDRARELASEGAEDVVVLADQQTGGRGRRNRAWRSPGGGIWLTALVRPTVPPARAPVYTLAAAVATTEAARELGVEATIKWPNDVLVDGRKLAGILTEMEGETGRVAWLAVGVGLNANVDPTALRTEQPVTSLQYELGEPVERRVVTQRLLESFHDGREDLDGVLERWRQYATTVGQRVRVESEADTVTGDAVDVTEFGALVVETDAGRETVAAGECEHLRQPAG